MRVEFEAGSLGSSLYYVPASCRRVALRVSIAVMSWMLGLVLMPLSSLASITSVGWIWYVCVVLEVCFMVSISCHVIVPVSRSGARCLRSLLD